MISMLAMAAMVSCTNEIETPDQPDQPVTNGLVEIKPQAGVGAIETKAIVSSIPGAGLNVSFWRPSDAATATWGTGSNIYAKLTDDEAITFYSSADRTTESKQYYNADATELSWLAGYYLGDKGGDITDGSVEFTIDGQDDIMATSGLSGNKVTAFKPFRFDHLLTQIDVVLKGDAAAQNAFGKIKSVKIKNIPTKLKLTVGTDPALAEQTDPNGDITIYDDATGIALSTNASNTIIGNTVMVYNGGSTPLGTASNKLTLEITSEKGGTAGVSTVDVETIDGGLAQGNKHIITLNFKEKIIVSAAIAPWGTDGKPGTGEVD